MEKWLISVLNITKIAKVGYNPNLIRARKFV